MRLLFTALTFCFLFSSCDPDEELTENGDVFIGNRIEFCSGYNTLFVLDDMLHKSYLSSYLKIIQDYL